jgi:chaperonin GroES
MFDTGTRGSMDIKVGDRVLYRKYAGSEFKLDGEELLIVDQGSVLAIIEA